MKIIGTAKTMISARPPARSSVRLATRSHPLNGDSRIDSTGMPSSSLAAMLMGTYFGFMSGTIRTSREYRSSRMSSLGNSADMRPGSARNTPVMSGSLSSVFSRSARLPSTGRPRHSVRFVCFRWLTKKTGWIPVQVLRLSV